MVMCGKGAGEAMATACHRVTHMSTRPIAGSVYVGEDVFRVCISSSVTTLVPPPPSGALGFRL